MKNYYVFKDAGTAIDCCDAITGLGMPVNHIKQDKHVLIVNYDGYSDTDRNFCDNVFKSRNGIKIEKGVELLFKIYLNAAKLFVGKELQESIVLIASNIVEDDISCVAQVISESPRAYLSRYDVPPEILKDRFPDLDTVYKVLGIQIQYLFPYKVFVAEDNSAYPHICMSCNGPAYIGFTNIDCKNKCKG